MLPPTLRLRVCAYESTSFSGSSVRSVRESLRWRRPTFHQRSVVPISGSQIVGQIADAPLPLDMIAIGPIDRPAIVSLIGIIPVLTKIAHTASHNQSVAAVWFRCWMVRCLFVLVLFSRLHSVLHAAINHSVGDALSAQTLGDRVNSSKNDSAATARLTTTFFANTLTLTVARADTKLTVAINSTHTHTLTTNSITIHIFRTVYAYS